MSTALSLVIAQATLLYGAILAIKLSVIPTGAAIFSLGGSVFPRLVDWVYFVMVITLRDEESTGIISLLFFVL